MKIFGWLFESNNRRIISYVSYSAAGLLLVVSLIWSVQIALANADATWSKANIKSKRDELASNKRNVQTVPVHHSQFDVPSGYEAVEQFRALTVAVAHENQVTLEQFSAASNLSPFATHYGGTLEATNYQQVHVQMSLSGNLAYVMQMFRMLAESKLPLEFDSVELTPQVVSMSGKDSIKMSARVEMDLITRGGT